MDKKIQNSKCTTFLPLSNNQTSMNRKDFYNNSNISPIIQNSSNNPNNLRNTTLSNSIKLNANNDMNINQPFLNNSNVPNSSKTNQMISSNTIFQNNNNQKITSKLQTRGNNQIPQLGNNQNYNVFNENPNSNISNIQTSFQINMKDSQADPVNLPFPSNKLMNSNINQEKNINLNESIKMSNKNPIDRIVLNKTYIPNNNFNKVSPLNNAFDNNCYQQIYINNNNNIISQPIRHNNQSNSEMSKEIILCDDHLKINFNMIAKRYCKHCATFLCDECVIQSHDSHIKDCKSSIDDILMKNQSEFVNLKKDFNDLYEKTKYVSSNVEEHEKNLKNDLNFKLSKIKEIKNLLIEIEEIEKNNTRDLIEEIKNLTMQEIDEKNKILNEDLKKNTNQIESLVKKWDKYSNIEKSTLIKNNFLDSLQLNYENLKQTHNKNNDFSKKLLKKISISVSKKIQDNNFDSMDNIVSRLIDFKDKVSDKERCKLDFNEIDDYIEDDESVRPSSYMIPKKQKKNINPNDYDLFIKTNKYDYEYLINIKGNEITYYSFKDKKIKTLSLENVKLRGDKFKLNKFYDNCKSVNLGSSLIVTGGSENKEESRNCFMIKIQDDQVYLSGYKSMRKSRQAHNIINISDKNTILVCGGFNCKETEYLEEGKDWESMSPLNKSRGNASLGLINERFVCCLGGYEVGKDSSSGNYLNSFEILDIDSKKNGWRFWDFPLKLNLCALGVISKSPNVLLICGGYDGKSYKNDTYEFELEKKNNGTFNPKIKKLDQELPIQTIFLQSNFCRFEDCAYSFDIYNNIIKYDLSDNSLNMIQG